MATASPADAVLCVTSTHNRPLPAWPGLRRIVLSAHATRDTTALGPRARRAPPVILMQIHITLVQLEAQPTLLCVCVVPGSLGTDPSASPAPRALGMGTLLLYVTRLRTYLAAATLATMDRERTVLRVESGHFYKYHVTYLFKWLDLKASDVYV